MPARGSSTVRRRRLGAELRKLREAADLTIDRVAEALECSDSKISRIETGQVGATPRDVRDMLALYRVDDGRRDELLTLTREARQKGWWRAYSDVPIAAHIGVEAEAAYIYSYQPLLVPGLLQTADFARAVVAAVGPDLPPTELDRRVELRMERQKLLTHEAPPRLWTILDEAVLRRTIGSPEIMREQIHHLAEVSAWPTVTIQVLQFATGAHAGMDGTFTIFEFKNPADPAVVYLEHITEELFLENVDTVDQHRSAFRHLSDMALAPDDSRLFLEKIVKEI